MKLFVIATYLCFGLALATTAYNLNLVRAEVGNLRTQVLQLSQAQAAYDDNALTREHSIQDSLEERIGTVEHDLDQIVFLMGKAGRK